MDLTPIEKWHDGSYEVQKELSQKVISCTKLECGTSINEVPKALTASFETCLPTASLWAVQHCFECEHLTTVKGKACCKKMGTIASPAAGAIQSLCIVAAAIAVAALLVWVESYFARDNTEKEDFEHGAYLIVASAQTTYKLPKTIFRFAEVMTVTAGFLGLCMIPFDWRLWVPLVCAAFVLPLVALDREGLIHQPVKCIGAPNTQKGFLLSLLRVVSLCCFGMVIWRWGIFANPALESFTKTTINFMWKDSKLHYYVPDWAGSATHFLPTWDALSISRCGVLVLGACLAVYTVGLLIRALCPQKVIAVLCREKELYPDHVEDEEAFKRHMKLLLNTTDANEVVRIYQRLEAHKDPQRSVSQRDVNLQSEQKKWINIPKGLQAFFDSIIWVLVDFVSDLKTIFGLIFAGNLWAGNLAQLFFLSLVMAHSALRQHRTFRQQPGMIEALRQSDARGMTHQQLIKVLDEEKGAECFFTLCVTTLSYAFLVQTAWQAVFQWVTIVYSSWAIAGHLVTKLDFPAKPVSEDRD